MMRPRISGSEHDAHIREPFDPRARSGRHGSMGRAPGAQAGYNITFLPLNGDIAAGGYEVFADGFRSVSSRPVGLAQAPDGSVYVSADAGGRIWRIMYRR